MADASRGVDQNSEQEAAEAHASAAVLRFWSLRSGDVCSSARGYLSDGEGQRSVMHIRFASSAVTRMYLKNQTNIFMRDDAYISSGNMY